jgi:transcriptional regulator with XRE-family HTH domain
MWTRKQSSSKFSSRMNRRRPTAKRSFGQILREDRLKTGLSQRALAARARVSTSLVALLESGKRTPRRDKVTALANALALSPRDRDRLLVSAGHSPSDASGLEAVRMTSPLYRSLEECLSDSRLTTKDRLTAEALLQTFARWLRSQLVAGRLNLSVFPQTPKQKR